MEKILLILPGWRANLSGYQKFLPYLPEVKTVLVELPGFQKKLAQPWGYQDYVNFLHQFVTQAGLKKFFLLGHSFGGCLALLFALHYPEKVIKLIIYNSPIVRRKTWRAKIIGFFASKFYFLLKLLPKKLSQKIRYFVYRYLVRSLDYYLVPAVMKETFRKVQKDLSAEFLQVKVPIYLIWGKQDKITPFAEIASLAREKKAKVYFLTGGHSVHQEKPAEFAKVIKEILDDGNYLGN